MSSRAVSKAKQQIVIRLERDTEDHILPRDFYSTIFMRFLPVLSLTYIASIIGIALSKGDFQYNIREDHTAYLMALALAAWVSVPSIIWILLRGSPLFAHVADQWYQALAAVMVLTILVSFILFPEANIYGMRIYLVSSIPAFIMIYLLFVKSWLPNIVAYGFNFMGICALLFGAFVNVTHL